MSAVVNTGTAGSPTFSALLKTQYKGAIREGVNNTSMVCNFTEKDTENVTSNSATISIHVGRNSGVGPGTERGNAPTPGRQGFIQVTTPTKKTWGTFSISAELRAAARDSRSAFDNALNREMKGLATDIRNYKDKTFTLDGTAALGVPDTTGNITIGTTAITLTNARDAIYFEDGMIIDFYNDTSVARHNLGQTVLSVNLSTGVINLTGTGIATQIDLGDAVRISVANAISDGSAAFNPFAVGVSTTTQGLRSIVNNTTLFTINPNTQPKYAAISGNGLNSGEAHLDTGGSQTRYIEQNCELLLDKLVNEGAGELPDLFFTSRTQLRHFQRQLRAERRQPDTVTLKSGREALVQCYEGKKIAHVGDRYIRNGESFAWRKQDLVLYESAPLDWFDLNGDIMLQDGSGTLQKAIMYELNEIAPRVRNNMIFKTDWDQTG